MHKYKNLIKEIPVDNQSAVIKKEIWARFSYKDKDIIEKKISEIKMKLNYHVKILLMRLI